MELYHNLLQTKMLTIRPCFRARDTVKIMRLILRRGRGMKVCRFVIDGGCVNEFARGGGGDGNVVCEVEMEISAINQTA